MLLDNDLTEEFKTLQPFYNITSTSEPYAISDFLTLLSPSYSILANNLMDKRPSKPDELSKKLTFTKVNSKTLSQPYQPRLADL